MVRTKKYLGGYDVDAEAVADALRRVADGMESGDVAVQSIDTTHSTHAEGDTIFGVDLEYLATHKYEDVVDVIRYATDAYLRYADKYVVEVLHGDHSATIRYELNRTFEPGDQIALVDEDGDTFGKAVVETTVELPARRVVEWGIGDWGDRSVDDLVGTLRELYADDSIDEATPVTAVLIGDVEPTDEYLREHWGMTPDEFFEALAEAPSGKWELPNNE